MDLNDFPTELLEEIFLFSIDIPKSQEQLYSPPSICCRSPTSICVISETCKRWRDIALNFAPLWTHLHVVDPGQVSIVKNLQVWIHRAGTLPLCLSLRQDQSNYREPIVAVVKLFLDSLHRCQSFELFSSIDLQHFSFGHVQKVPLTSLESVNVWCRNVRLQDTEWFANLLLNTRSLRTICWFWRCTDRPFIPWENLRDLSTCGKENLGEFFNALSCCQNLEHLRIHGPISRSSMSATPPQVTLPRVTHLMLLLDVSSKILLERLILPSLVDLEILRSFRMEWASVLDLIQRSDVMLRRLAITRKKTPTYRRLDQAELITALKMPYFQELRVLEIEELLDGGYGIVQFLTQPRSRNTSAEGGGGNLVHLERIGFALERTQQARKIVQALKKLAKSRLGRLYDRKTARKHIEITTDIRFFLSIPSA